MPDSRSMHGTLQSHIEIYINGKTKQQQKLNQIHSFWNNDLLLGKKDSKDKDIRLMANSE